MIRHAIAMLKNMRKSHGYQRRELKEIAEKLEQARLQMQGMDNIIALQRLKIATLEKEAETWRKP